MSGGRAVSEGQGDLPEAPALRTGSDPLCPSYALLGPNSSSAGGDKRAATLPDGPIQPASRTRRWRKQAARR